MEERFQNQVQTLLLERVLCLSHEVVEESRDMREKEALAMLVATPFSFSNFHTRREEMRPKEEEFAKKKKALIVQLKQLPSHLSIYFFVRRRTQRY